MIELDATWILIGLAGVILGPGGAAWVGARASLNGFKAETRASLKGVDEQIAGLHGRCKRIEGKVDELGVRDADQGAKIAKLEGKVGDG